jgi:hypothetical protein
VENTELLLQELPDGITVTMKLSLLYKQISNKSAMAA